MGKASVKVEGGKMVNVKIDNSKVSVTGDFFIEPPEARQEIERKLESMGQKPSEDEVLEAVQKVEADLIGFSAENVAEAYIKAGETE